jgi:hypothetical protein
MDIPISVISTIRNSNDKNRQEKNINNLQFSSFSNRRKKWQNITQAKKNLNFKSDPKNGIF